MSYFDLILYQGLYQALGNVNVEQVATHSATFVNYGSIKKSYVRFQLKVLLITSITTD